jgi:hypothetical protein
VTRQTAFRFPPAVLRNPSILTDLLSFLPDFSSPLDQPVSVTSLVYTPCRELKNREEGVLRKIFCVPGHGGKKPLQAEIGTEFATSLLKTIRDGRGFIEDNGD